MKRRGCGGQAFLARPALPPSPAAAWGGWRFGACGGIRGEWCRRSRCFTGATLRHAVHQPVQVGQGQQVHGQQVQLAGAEQRQHLVVGQFAQLVLVHHHQPGHREAAAVHQVGLGAHLRQQAGIGQLAAEGFGAQVLDLVALQEVQRVLQERGVAALVVEQRFAFLLVQPGESLVDAHAQLLARQLGQHEGIAAHEGRDVGGGPAVLPVHEQVLAVAQPQHHHRRDLAARLLREDDRVLLAGLGELHPGQVQRVGLPREAEAAARADLAAAVLLAIEQDRLFVIQGLRHPHSSFACVVPGRASTLSMRLPSRSTTSKVQDPHSIRSPTFGRWPDTAISNPATVL